MLRHSIEFKTYVLLKFGFIMTFDYNEKKYIYISKNVNNFRVHPSESLLRNQLVHTDDL